MVWFSRKPSDLDQWETVFHAEEPDMSYETNEFVVQQHKETKQFRYGDDGGCSCYDGFDPENFAYTYNKEEVLSAIRSWADFGYSWDDGERKAKMSQIAIEVMEDAQEALRAAR